MDTRSRLIYIHRPHYAVLPATGDVNFPRQDANCHGDLDLAAICLQSPMHELGLWVGVAEWRTGRGPNVRGPARAGRGGLRVDVQLVRWMSNRSDKNAWKSPRAGVLATLFGDAVPALQDKGS